MPMSLTYSFVVSQDSVHIILLITALNELKIMACNINAYLTVDCQGNIWTYAGLEFGSERGKLMIINKALYGLKSSGTAFWTHLAKTLYGIGFVSTKANPDVWICLGVKPDSTEYYEYVMCYVDDILSVSLDAIFILKSLQGQFKLKDDKIEPPNVSVGTMEVEGHHGWFMLSEKYVKSAIQNIEDTLQKAGQCLPLKCKTLLVHGYHPELDTSPELKLDGLQQYQELIGIL